MCEFGDSANDGGGGEGMWCEDSPAPMCFAPHIANAPAFHERAPEGTAPLYAHPESSTATVVCKLPTNKSANLDPAWTAFKPFEWLIK